MVVVACSFCLKQFLLPNNFAHPGAPAGGRSKRNPRALTKFAGTPGWRLG
jgi:hypothetical protein